MVERHTNPLELLVGYRLRRISSDAMGELARSLAKLGLRPTEASALVLISANDGMTQSDIGRILGIQRANMAPLTAALERKGLIERRRMDGRSQNLVVSEEGAKIVADVHVAMQANDASLVAKMPDPLRAGFAQALTILSDAS